MRQEGKKFFPEHGGKGSLLSRFEAETGLLWMWMLPSASSRVETSMSGIFLSCSKGVKDLCEFQSLAVINLETHQWKWASSRLEK